MLARLEHAVGHFVGANHAQSALRYTTVTVRSRYACVRTMGGGNVEMVSLQRNVVQMRAGAVFDMSMRRIDARIR